MGQASGVEAKVAEVGFGGQRWLVGEATQHYDSSWGVSGLGGRGHRKHEWTQCFETHTLTARVRTALGDDRLRAPQQCAHIIHDRV